MSDDTPYKAFTRARLQAGDDLRRKGKLTAAARLVGLEIFNCVNRVSGGAWPSQKTIADRLGIDDRTVRRAIKQLKAAGCIRVMHRRGCSNVYFPLFVDRTEDILSGVEPRPTEDKSSSDPGQNVPRTPDKNDPLTLSSNPVRTPSTEAAAEEKRKRSLARASRQKAENEIAEVIGWHCTTEIPREEFEDLCRRWPDVDAAELFELKQKYEPPAIVGGRRARAAGGA
jgi:Helix-turn-helix domain